MIERGSFAPMKRIICAALLLSMLLSIVGCGKKENTEQQQTQEGTVVAVRYRARLSGQCQALA